MHSIAMVTNQENGTVANPVSNSVSNPMSQVLNEQFYSFVQE
jgi:hypothetical protein